MTDRRFYALLVLGTITAAPAIAFAWLLVVATVNWHDALQVTCTVAVLVHLWRDRRERRTTARALREERRAAWTDTAAWDTAAEPAGMTEDQWGQATWDAWPTEYLTEPVPETVAV